MSVLVHEFGAPGLCISSKTSPSKSVLKDVSGMNTAPFQSYALAEVPVVSQNMSQEEICSNAIMLY